MACVRVLRRASVPRKCLPSTISASIVVAQHSAFHLVVNVAVRDGNPCIRTWTLSTVIVSSPSLTLHARVSLPFRSPTPSAATENDMTPKP